jgi:hypothetical protein
VTELTELPIDRLTGDVAAAFFFSDESPPCGVAALLDWRLGGRLTGLIKKRGVVGEFGEHLLLRSNRKVEAPWTLFVGGGARPGLDLEGLRWRLRHLFETARLAGFRTVALGLDCLSGIPSAELFALVDKVLDDLDGGGIDCRLSRLTPAGVAVLP